MSKLELESTPVNTGLQSSLNRSGKNKNSDPKMAEQLEAQRKEDRKLVRGKFIYHETPRGNIGFNFRSYKGDPLETYHMKDGEIYTIPKGVAKHLNKNCDYPTYNYRNDEAGRPVVSVAERVRRCSFQSLEFVDLEPKKAGKNSYEASALPN